MYPARHFVTPEGARVMAMKSIRAELDEVLPTLGPIERFRLEQRTNYDLEMIQETGSCKGIENYSRHFDGRQAGEKPYCLLDYFPDDFLMIIDESHQMIPQLHGMYNGDRSRKKALIDYGFRLPSAYDNRPLRFHEFEQYMTTRSSSPRHRASTRRTKVRDRGRADHPADRPRRSGGRSPADRRPDR